MLVVARYSDVLFFEEFLSHDGSVSHLQDFPDVEIFFFGRTSLHFAASRGNLDILGYLLERASLTEVRRADNEGRTAIHYTVQSPRLEAVDMLLASGGELSVRDNSARTVLHHAALWGNLEAARKVMALGDSEVLLSPDKSGHMPSHLACGLKAIPVRDFLLSLEAAASLRMEANPFSVDAASRLAGEALVYSACSAQCPSPTSLPIASQKEGGRHKGMLGAKRSWLSWVAAVSVLLLYFLYSSLCMRHQEAWPMDGADGEVF